MPVFRHHYGGRSWRIRARASRRVWESRRFRRRSKRRCAERLRADGAAAASDATAARYGADAAVASAVPRGRRGRRQRPRARRVRRHERWRVPGTSLATRRAAAPCTAAGRPACGDER
eukprot:1915369-Pleurochrysis_carterae.AAC.1